MNFSKYNCKLKTIITNNHTYFPQPESQGGVCFLNVKTEIKNLTSINLDKLNEGYDSNRCYVVHGGCKSRSRTKSME